MDGGCEVNPWLQHRGVAQGGIRLHRRRPAAEQAGPRAIPHQAALRGQGPGRPKVRNVKQQTSASIDGRERSSPTSSPGRNFCASFEMISESDFRT